MDKVIEMQRGKAVGAYGGPESIIETNNNGSLRIQPFDQWPLYRAHLVGGRHGQPTADGQKYIFHDARLESRLRSIGYTGVEGLFQPAVEFSSSLSERKYDPGQADLRLMVSAKIFPTWFYCPKCRRMHRYDEWESLWDNAFPNDGRFKENVPACPYCSSQNGQRIRRYPLQQVRFALASMDSGELRELPWDELPTSTIANQLVTLDGQRNEVELVISSGRDGLDAIKVRAVNDHSKVVQLSRVNSPNYFVFNGSAYRLVLKNDNNVYFPIVETSINIPIVKFTDAELTIIQRKYNVYCNLGLAQANALQATLSDLNDPLTHLLSYYLTMDKLQQLIANNFVELPITDVFQILNEEFCYITNSNNYDANGLNDKDEFIAEHQNIGGLPSRITDVYCLRLLKETSVQVAYTRIFPSEMNDPSRDVEVMQDTLWFDVATGVENAPSNLKIKPVVSCPKQDVKYMLASRASGEGLFFKLDVRDISIPSGNRFVYMHTLSHILMKELEFQCGYSLTSLKERIYINNDECGILIYTASGEDGCYGGLSSLYPNNIPSIVSAAIQRAKHCTNDPICSGHCFACTDIPETSCQNGNRMLDRRLFLLLHK